MSAYHNAVSDKLVLHVFSNHTIYIVLGRNSEVKWTELVQNSTFPSTLDQAIFSSTSIVSVNQNFTLVPLKSVEDDQFYQLNHTGVPSLSAAFTEEFKVVYATHQGIDTLKQKLVGAAEYSDIQLWYNYTKTKGHKDALFFCWNNKKLTISAWKNGQFLLANRYIAENEDELFYYVMLVVEQLDLPNNSLYFECLCTKGLHENYQALFKNYLPSLHLTPTQMLSVSEHKEDYLLASFYTQCVL